MLRMVERGEQPRFALEAREPIRDRCANDARQDLDRDVAPQLRVAGAVDLAHAARAELGIIMYGPSRDPLARAMGGAILHRRVDRGADS